MSPRKRLYFNIGSWSCYGKFQETIDGQWIGQYHQPLSLHGKNNVQWPQVVLWFFSDSWPWVATRYCCDRSVVRWRWSSWNVWHSGTNERKDETSQMPGEHSNQQLCEARRSTCKDQYEKTWLKMCRHQLNGWSWKDDEKVTWKYQSDREDSCTWVTSDYFFYNQRGFASQVEKWEKRPMSLICSLV